MASVGLLYSGPVALMSLRGFVKAIEEEYLPYRR
jgi:hypothetical protein